MKITKIHGAGNDFILINNFEENIPEKQFEFLANKLCQRRTSVGADGLILAERPKAKGDIQMVFYNSDGTRGEMCGNGARCLARFSYDEGLVKESMVFETLAGIVQAKRYNENEYWVRLPNPSCIEPIELTIDNTTLRASYVELGSPGVPHLCVEFPELDTISSEELFSYGQKLRYHPSLEKGANVNFYKRLDSTYLLEKTYERGVEDFTMACGTGSASVALALQKQDITLRDQRIRLSVPGGELLIESKWKDEQVESVDLIGPTEVVFTGNVEIKKISSEY